MSPTERPPHGGQKTSWTKRLRRRLRPLHPNRLRASTLHLVHRLGWYRLRLWLAGLAPRRLLLSWRWWRALRRRTGRRRQERRLKVAVDISPFWQPLTGVGWYLYRLLEALAERDDVRLRLYGPGLVDAGDAPAPHKAPPQGPAIETVCYRVPGDFSIVPASFASWLRRRAGRLIAADGNDVLFAPNYLLPPCFRGVAGAHVAVVHDLSAYIVPETMRSSTLEQLRGGLASAIERSQRVITDSETVRSELVSARLVAAETVDVVPLAPALETSPEDAGSDAGHGAVPDAGRYVLFVGTLEPRKNLEMLIEAFEKYHAGPAGGAGELRTGPARLLVCGGVGWKAEAVLERLESADCVRYEGYVSDRALARFYRGAEWLVLPSIYEGFGLPAVEAMAAGVPLLLSDIPVLREVAGAAALYAPPDDVAAWTEMLSFALSRPDVRRDFAARARQRSGRFSWRATAEATVASWRRAAGRGEHPAGGRDGAGAPDRAP